MVTRNTTGTTLDGVLDSLQPKDHIVDAAKSDSVDLANPGILLIGTGGAVKIDTVAGDTVTVTVPAGYLYVPVKRVWSTGTTATGISVLY